MIPVIDKDWRKTISCPPDLHKWMASRPDASFFELWEDTTEPIWLPYLAQVVKPTKKQFVLAACGVARLALPFITDRRRRARRALENTEAWCQERKPPFQ